MAEQLPVGWWCQVVGWSQASLLRPSRVTVCNTAEEYTSLRLIEGESSEWCDDVVDEECSLWSRPFAYNMVTTLIAERGVAL
jgi:hypothetical protein